MRAFEFVREGGWDTTLTQGTVLKPQVVSQALVVIDQFVKDFNAFLAQHNLGPVRRGKPTGSSAYYEKDQAEDPEKIYGDIDLQMIAPAVPGKTQNQMAALMNRMADEFVKSGAVDYIDPGESKPGHPIVKIGDSDYVQVDFMWHEEQLARWGAARVTPEHGVKGLLFGNMFSVFGSLLDLSIQHAGVQMKTVAGKKVSFSKQKDVEVVTISQDPENFVLDVFKFVANDAGIKDPKIHSLLKAFPGNRLDEVKISNLVNAVKGFAYSAEINQMFGQGHLENYSSADDFLNKFTKLYEQKAMADVEGSKRDKATTPEAQARAKADVERILSGLETVKQALSSRITT